MSDPPPFRGWRIVGVGFATQAVAIGFSIATFSLFVPHLVEEFGSDRGTITLGQSLMMLVMTTAGPVIGRVLDRGSIRAVMTLGALLNAGCLALLAAAQELWQLALLFGVGMALGTAMVGPLGSATAVAKWFRAKLGQAQGIAAMGAPAGGLLFAPIAGVLIERFGWRTTVLWFAAGTLLVVPAIWAVVRNRPEDLGQLPDGAAPGEAGDAAAAAGHGHGGHGGDSPWNAGLLLREPRFWFLALAVGMLMGITSGWIANFASFCEDLGVETQQAGIVLGAAAGIGILGTLSFGAMADRLDLRVLLWAILGAHIAGFLFLRTQPGYGGLLGAMVLLGFAGGGMMPVYAALIGRIFGPASFGQVMGLAGLLMLPFAFAAPPLGGYLRDTTGSYESTLLLFSVALAVACGVLALLQVSTPRPVAGSVARA